MSENQTEFEPMDWDDDAGSRPVFPSLPEGDYQGEWTQYEVNEFTAKTGRSKGIPQKSGSITVEVVDAALGKVYCRSGGAFGKYNTNFASGSGSKWPVFARNLGIVKQMTPADVNAMLPAKVAIHVIVEEYDAPEQDEATGETRVVKRSKNTITSINRI